MIISQPGSTLEEFRAVLTSPFLVKKVTINSHDMFNPPKPAEETYSKSDFPKMKSTYAPKLKLKDYNVGIIDYSKDSADIVKNMIQDGYSTKHALDVQKAIKAYGLNAINTAGGVYNISTTVEEV